MRARTKGRVSKVPHKLSDSKTFTPEDIAEAKRRITARRRSIENERIDREVEEQLK